MTLNKDILLKIGFNTNNPEITLGNFELNEFGKYKIIVIAEFKPMVSGITFNCDCNKLNSNGLIIKRAYLSNIKTTEELQKLFELCEIDFKIDSKFLL